MSNLWKKRTSEWYLQSKLLFRQCNNCEFAEGYGKNSKEAKIEWNKTVEMHLKYEREKRE